MYLSALQGNIGQEKMIDLSVNTNFQPAKWWTVNLYVEVYNNAYQGAFYDGYLNQSKTTFSANGSNQFTISKTWSAEISGWYDGGGTYGQFHYTTQRHAKRCYSEKNIKQ